MLFAETYDDSFGVLLHTVPAGGSGFRKVVGIPLFAHFESDAEAAGVFDLAMAEQPVHRFPQPVAFGQIPPRSAGPRPEPHPVGASRKNCINSV